jgi:flagellar biosynthesis/type III secretory pathway protein FliH
MWESLRAAPVAPAPTPPDPVQSARAEAEAILAAARADAERLRAEVAAAARAEAARRGRAEARIDLRRMMREARALLREARGVRQQALAELGDEVVDTAVALAKAVLRRNAEQGADDLRRLALDLMAEAREPRLVRVNPADAPALAGLPVELEPDPGLGRGGMVLVAADGERDARLETRIARLEAAIRAGDGA